MKLVYFLLAIALRKRIGDARRLIAVDMAAMKARTLALIFIITKDGEPPKSR